jgi:hypothetical protein
MSAFMAQFGVVKEVVRVADRGEEIAIACEIDRLETEIQRINEKAEQLDGITKK